MKYKLIAIILVFGVLFGGGMIWAEGTFKTIEVFFDRINISVNGQSIPMNKDAIIYNGSVYVPIRNLSDLLGAEVGWNQADRSISLDFIADQSDTAFQASQKGLYQYIAITNNQIMARMIDNFKNNNMEKMKEEIANYEKLRLISINLKNKEMEQIFEKLKFSAELMRSGWVSKKLDDYYLAWSIFSTNAGNLNTLLKEKISDKK